MSHRRIGSFITTALLLAVVIVAALNIQRIQDTFLYYQYQPDPMVASFVPATGMSEQGKFLFYASQPSLEGPETFNQRCEKHDRSTAILGCYDGFKIYIYDIQEPRLAGIRPTTAAHEMLHAAYRRLGSEERQRVDQLLDAEYEKLKGDPELAERMAFYERTQPGEHRNELHSIIGTEIASISDDLESYYGRYFSDRSKVIQQHEQYHSVFKELRAKADALSARIDELSQTIKNLTAEYESESTRVQSAISRFNARADNGEFESQAEFNRERQALLGRTAALERKRGQINAAINEHNSLVTELNSIATETNSLNRSLDSQLAPAPSL